MNDNTNKLETLVAWAKRRGFIYQGSEIYGGLGGTWDYGPLGVELKNNIKQLWWKMFVHERPDMYGLDAAILMNARVWDASGHTGAGFADPMVEDTVTKERYRADHLLGELGHDTEGKSLEEMNAIIRENDMASPNGNPLGEIQQFNMMFQTHVGAVQDSANVSYLRPETAQGIFTNFKNVVDTFHPSIPFGIAQIGKAFRNEITPKDFIFRVREFEQMEIEYFIREEAWQELFEEWRSAIQEWHSRVGLDSKKIHELEVPEEDLAHYSKRTIDFEYEYPFGKDELCGFAYRTDFDLSNHQEHSGAKLEYIDQQSNERFIPHVLEPSFGIDRLVLALIDSAYTVEDVDGEERVVMKFKKELAPVKVAVLPLMKKDGLPEKAHEIYTTLAKGGIVTRYDETASIGKRYRRQDEIGTPLCITIDYDTLEDDTVTVRDRDTMEQERVSIADLYDYVQRELSE